MRGLITRYEKASTLPNKAGERYIAYDESRNEALVKEPPLAWLRGSRITYYGVKIDQPSGNEQVTASIEVGNMRDAQFRILYRTSIPEEGAFRVVGKLGHLTDPVEEFERLLKRWIRRYYEANPTAAERFLQTRDQAIRFLINEAEEEFGVRLSCEIELSGADPQESKSIHIPDLDLKVLSYSPVIIADLKCDIDVDPEGFGLAAARDVTDEQIRWELQRSVRAYVLENEQLDSICFDMARVNDRLARHLNSDLRPFGRKLRHVELSLVKGPPVPNHTYEVDDSVDVKVIDGEGRVQIRHHLVLNLDDFVTFARVRRVEPEKITAWCKDLLKSITVDETHGKRYADLVLKFDEDTIRRRIREAVREIGFDVKVYSGLPAVEAIELRDRPQTYEAKLQLDTMEIARPVDLSIEVRYQLRDLELIRNRIRPDADTSLREDIEAEIARSAKDAVAKLDAGQFYFYFSIPPDPQAPIEPPPEWNRRADTVEAYLRDKIVETLTKDFGAVVERINLRPAQGAITERVDQLRRAGVIPLQLENIANLYEGGAAAPVTYVVHFQILGVDPDNWPAFLAANPSNVASYDVGRELIQISALLRDSLTGRLKRMPADLIQFVDEQGRQDMLKVLEEATQPVRTALGLIVNLVEVDREATEDEGLETNRHRVSQQLRRTAIEKEAEVAEALIEARTSDIKTLIQEKSRLLRDEPDNEEAIEEIDEKIKKIAPSSTSASKDEASLLSPPPKRRRGSDLDNQDSGMAGKGNLRVVESKGDAEHGVSPQDKDEHVSQAGVQEDSETAQK